MLDLLVYPLNTSAIDYGTLVEVKPKTMILKFAVDCYTQEHKPRRFLPPFSPYKVKRPDIIKFSSKINLRHGYHLVIILDTGGPAFCGVKIAIIPLA
jgi:hypothetical protein